MPRRSYLDWLRGLAVVIMILWHSMDAWTTPAARRGAAFNWIVFIGGWAAPLFLFLAGVSVALAGSAWGSRLALRLPLRAPRAKSRGGAGDRWSRARLVQKRGWQIFLLAFLFRAQSFILNPGAAWITLLKPDILNILGLGIVMAAECWRRAATPMQRAIWLGVPAAAVVLLTPSSRGWWWPALLGKIAAPLEGYIRPVAGVGGFSLFPWVAFVLAGTFVGSIIAESRAPEREPAFHARLGLAGLAVAIAGLAGSYLPSPFVQSSFWTTSLSFFLIRLGVMTMGIALAWIWMRRPRADHWSPMVIFGRTSLFVYWVHVELAYGFISYPLHGALPLRGAFAAFLGLTVLMLGGAVLWLRRRRPLVPDFLRSARIGR